MEGEASCNVKDDEETKARHENGEAYVYGMGCSQEYLP